MNLKTLFRILALLFAALLIVGIVTPLEKTAWAEAKRSEERGERHGRSDLQEEADKALLEESSQQRESKRERRSQNKFSMQRILKPLAKETVLMGVPFVVTLGVMKIRRWKSKSKPDR
jgi:hypothetical protein